MTKTTHETRSTGLFIRHYVEMVVAMMVGMMVLGAPMAAVSGRPALLVVEMAVAMTVPMVAWMRFRGHSWRLCTEMTAAMLLPLAGMLVLLGAGVVGDTHALLCTSHSLMLPSMLVAMLLRRDEYSTHGGPPGAVVLQPPS